MRIHEKIKKARISAGLSQKELAERMGQKSYTSITHIEKGKNSPSFKMLQKIAEVLGCTAEFEFKPKNK